MNKRIKEKRRKAIMNGQTTKKLREANKRICQRFPFLIPRNVFTDKITWDIKLKGDKKQKAYSYTLANDFPKGWWKAFGLQLCEELREDLIKCNYLYQFRIEQIKEKFSQLRIYTGSLPRESRVWEIIEDYSTLSENICMRCGKPDVPMLNYGNWLITICEDCYNKNEKRRANYLKKSNINKEYKVIPYSKYVIKDDKGQMANIRRVKRYQNGETKIIEYDIKEKAEKIRARWRQNHAI